jgi:hypothetical protein
MNSYLFDIERNPTKAVGYDKKFFDQHLPGIGAGSLQAGYRKLPHAEVLHAGL